MASTAVAVPFFSGLRESSLQLELKEPLWSKGSSRCFRTVSVELNTAESLFICAEYGRLEIVKLTVTVFKWYPTAVVDSVCTSIDGEGSIVEAVSGFVVGSFVPISL